jgi:hypothetical protein
MLNLGDVYDDEALKRIHSSLGFSRKLTNGRATAQASAGDPDLGGRHPVWRAAGINNKSDDPFGETKSKVQPSFSRRWPPRSASECKRETRTKRRRATKYDVLIVEGVMTAEELQQCMQQGGEEASRSSTR